MKKLGFIGLLIVLVGGFTTSCKDIGGKESKLSLDTTISLEAREWSKKIEEYPENVEFYKYRAEVFTENKRHDLAIADYNKCVELEADNASNYYKLADAYFANDETTNALEQYEQATKISNTDITATFKLAQFLYFVRQFDRSERIFGKLLQLDPSHADGNFLTAMLLKEKGDTVGAISQFEKTLSLLGADYNSTMQLANLYDLTGNKERALINYNRAVSMDEKSDEALYARGLFHQKNNEKELALKDYQATIDINAKHYYAYYNAGNILAEQASYPRAIDHFEICLRLNSDFAKAYNRIGQCFELLNENEKARNYYDKCLQIDPNFALAKEGLARIGL